MKAYINENINIIISGKITDIKLNKEIFEKINLQTNKTFLILVNGEIVFNNNVNKVLDELREARDNELKKTDYLFFSDNSYLTTTAEKTELKARRKYLRDITEGLITVEQVLQKIKEFK